MRFLQAHQKITVKGVTEKTMREVEKRVDTNKNLNNGSRNWRRGVGLALGYPVRLVALAEEWFYRSYQGFGIIIYLALLPLVGPLVLLALLQMPFPLNTIISLAAVFGWICVTRSRWHS